jgi:hypothetical protein
MHVVPATLLNYVCYLLPFQHVLVFSIVTLCNMYWYSALLRSAMLCIDVPIKLYHLLQINLVFQKKIVIT